ncbi:MAG: hypothetical protein AABZ06_04955 [Bdellovibrionota bacterium]
MKTITTAMIMFSALTFNVSASELDPVIDQVPQGLIVRFSADGKREVFKANLSNGIVDSDATAVEAITDNIKPDNKIESVTPGTELDNVTSNESWHWFWNTVSYLTGGYGGYYNYSYNCGGSSYNYYPSHSYYSGGYNYNYYYTPTHYGYRTGYSHQDRWGYHYGSRYGWHGGRGRY